MSDGFVPDDDGFVPDADTGAAGSPLEKALAEQKGEMVTVKTPTGDALFNRQGQRVATGEEYAARNPDDFKQWLLGGALSFMGGGGKLIDEIRGADAAVKTGLQVAGAGGNPIDPMRTAYNTTRNQTRKQVAEEQLKHPIAGVAGAVAPYLAAPGPKGAAGRIALGSATAGIDELGGSTSEGFGDIAKDVAMATGAGAVFSGAAEGVFAPLRWAGGKLSSKAGEVASGLLAKTQGLRDKATSSAVGKLGSIGSQQMNVADHVLQVLKNPTRFPLEVVQAAEAFQASPAGRQVLERGAINAIEKGPSLLNQEQAARGALAQAMGAAQPAKVASEVTQSLQPGAVASEIGGNFMRGQAPKLAMAGVGAGLGAGVSALTGHDKTAGALGGAVGGSFLATPGTMQFLRNTAGNPRVQTVALQGLEALTEGFVGGGSAGARVMTPALAQEGRQNAYAKLMEQFGIQPEDDEDISTKGFILSQREPSMQSK